MCCTHMDTTEPITKRQKKNAGELPQYLVRNCHPAIISRETFNLVNAEIKRRGVAGTKTSTREKSRQEETYSSKYALSELLVCGECNTLYRRCIWKKGEKVRVVWRCCNRLSYGTKYCRKSPTLDETLLYDVVVQAINQQLYRPEYLLAPFERQRQKTLPLILGTLFCQLSACALTQCLTAMRISSKNCCSAAVQSDNSSANSGCQRLRRFR